MGHHASLTHSLLALRGLTLRRDWLYARLCELPTEAQLTELGCLCDEAERLEPRHREALAAWVMVLVQRGKEAWVERLHHLALARGFESLCRLLRRYPPSALADDLPSRILAGSQGRQLSLGERKSYARHPNRRIFEQLLRDPHPMVIRQLLVNPHLTENDIIALLATRLLHPSTIETLAEFPEWMTRPRVRMAILHHPFAPSYVTIPLLSLLIRQELEEISKSPILPVVLRATAQERRQMCPPLDPTSDSTLH